MENVFTKNTIPEVEFLLEVLDLSPGARILDIGCGAGRHSVELAKRGYDVTGADISSGMLEQASILAKEKDVNVNWVLADATKSLPKGEYNAAICLCEGSIGLLNPGDDPIDHTLSVLKNIHSVLKPGARMVLNALSAHRMIRAHTQEDVDCGIFDPMTTIGFSQEEVPSGTDKPAISALEKGFTPIELSLFLRMAGFKVLHLYGGTAGNWGKRPLELDEYEIMAIVERV